MSQDSIVTVPPEICHIQKFGTSLDMPQNRKKKHAFAARTYPVWEYPVSICRTIQRGIAANPPEIMTYHDDFKIVHSTSGFTSVVDFQDSMIDNN